jgi:hypothetical protein
MTTTESYAPRPGAFVPRPIYHVKPYGYVVEIGDTAQGITEKLGMPRASYRELVAANLYGRRLVPQPLGSPYSCRTFGDLMENEVLRIPSHWPEVPGAVGPAGVNGPQSLGAPQLDALAQSILAASQAISASNPAKYSPDMVAAAANAATQWWYSANGSAPSSNPADYIPLVASAFEWAKQIVPVLGPSVTPTQLSSFPWGAMLSMLPAVPKDFTKIDWAGMIPGTVNVPWTSIPWGYLASVGTDVLEGYNFPPVVIPASASPAEVATAWQKAILQGMWKVGETCGKNAKINPDFYCVCDSGYQYESDATTDCVPSQVGPGPVGPPPPPPTPITNGGCGPGTTYDPNGADGVGCYTCQSPFLYDKELHSCGCGPGRRVNNAGTGCENIPGIPGGGGDMTPRCPAGSQWVGGSPGTEHEGNCVPTTKKPETTTALVGNKTSTAVIALATVGAMAFGAGVIYVVAQAVKEPKGKK